MSSRFLFCCVILIKSILVCAPSSIIRRLHRCCCCAPSGIDNVRSFNVDAPASRSFELDTFDDIQMVTPANDIGSSLSSDGDMGSANSMRRSVRSNGIEKLHAQKEKILCFYHYIRVLLKQMVSDIEAIPSRIFTSAHIKVEVIEYKETLISCSKCIKNIRCRDENINITAWNNDQLTNVLTRQQISIAKLNNASKPLEMFLILQPKLSLIDMFYSCAVRQIRELNCMLDGVVSMEVSTFSSTVPQTFVEPTEIKESFFDGYVTNKWLEECAQSVANYLLSTVSHKPSVPIKTFRLQLHIFPETPYLFPFAHALMIFVKLTEIANYLQLSSFRIFIQNTVTDDDKVFITKFGASFPWKNDTPVDIQQNDLRSLRRSMSFIVGGQFSMQYTDWATTIECKTKPIRIREDLGQKKLNYYFGQLHTRIPSKQAKPNLNYTSWIFDVSYMSTARNITTKTIQVHELFSSTLDTMKNTKKQFTVTNFVRKGLLNQKQHGRYLGQIDSFITAFKGILKETNANNKVTKLQILKKNVNSMKNQMLWTFGIRKTINYVKTNKTERSNFETKTENILTNLMQCTFQMDAITMALQSEKQTWLTQSLASLLTNLPRIWKHVCREYTMFRELRFIVKYKPGLKYLDIPWMFVRWVQIMLNMVKKYSSNVAVFSFAFVPETPDSNFLLELHTNGEPWSVDAIQLIQETAKSKYLQMDVASLKESNYGMQPVAMFGAMHQIGGECGIRKIVNRHKVNSINKIIHCSWPVDSFNDDFDFAKWNTKYGDKKTETKEVSTVWNAAV